MHHSHQSFIHVISVTGAVTQEDQIDRNWPMQAKKKAKSLKFRL